MSASAGFFIYGAQGYSGSRQYASNYYGTVNWTNISQISWYGSSAKA